MLHKRTSSTEQKVLKRDRNNKDRPRSVSSSGIMVTRHNTINNNHQRPSSVGSGGGGRLSTASSTFSKRTASSRPPSSDSYGSLRRCNSEERIRRTVCIYTGSSGLLRHQHQTNNRQGQFFRCLRNRTIRFDFLHSFMVCAQTYAFLVQGQPGD